MVALVVVVAVLVVVVVLVLAARGVSQTAAWSVVPPQVPCTGVRGLGNQHPLNP